MDNIKAGKTAFIFRIYPFAVFNTESGASARPGRELSEAEAVYRMELCLYPARGRLLRRPAKVILRVKTWPPRKCVSPSYII